MKKYSLIFILTLVIFFGKSQDTIYTIHYQEILVHNIQQDVRRVYFNCFQDSLQKRYLNIDEILSIHYADGKIDTIQEVNMEAPYLTYSHKGWKNYLKTYSSEAYHYLQLAQQKYKTSYTLFGVGCGLMFVSVPVYFFVKGNQAAWLGLIAGIGAVTTIVGIPFYIKGNKHYAESISTYSKTSQKVTLNFNFGINTTSLSLKF